MAAPTLSRARRRTAGPRVALVALLAASAGTACRSAPTLRVDKDVLEKITIENKLLLFDAENELNIAIDSRDQVVDEIEQTKQDIRRTEKKRDVAARDASVFSSKGYQERAKVADARAREADARVDYLEARLGWVRERLGKERAKLVVAKAEFELAKARLVKKNNVPGASGLELADFERQVKKYAEDVTDADADIQKAEAKMKQREETWAAMVKQLQAATGGALGSKWLD